MLWHLWGSLDACYSCGTVSVDLIDIQPGFSTWLHVRTKEWGSQSYLMSELTAGTQTLANCVTAELCWAERGTRRERGCMVFLLKRWTSAVRATILFWWRYFSLELPKGKTPQHLNTIYLRWWILVYLHPKIKHSLEAVFLTMTVFILIYF